jgi:acyl-CoA reductase-like NAD-dependent aldehyde dehydrogenase
VSAPVDVVACGAFISGEWHTGSAPNQFEVLNPATAHPIARVDACGRDEVDTAARAAQAAFEEWRWRAPRERGRLLGQVAGIIREHAAELAQLESRENGKPARDALRFDVTYAHMTFDYFAGLADTLSGEIVDQGSIQAHVIREPYGVVGAILPFNWPPIHFAAKCAPALAAGNSVVIKPGEQAPLTVLRLVELANQVLPPGLLNAVTGIDAGIALAAHPGLGRLTFTGASDTGRKVMASAARTLTLPTMELGGKNALIVFPDADLDAALSAAIEGMFFNQGEACTATARILVHDNVYDEVVERFAIATRRLVVGEGIDPATDIGPMVDRRQQERVLSYVQIAHQEGARLVAKGTTPNDPRLARGFWVAPTVFADVTPDMRLAQEEVFGPVAGFMRFSTEAQALEIANGTAYGLTAALFTGDLERARRMAARLEAGMVFVNNYFRASLLGSPFGGVKDSGFGREGAPETLHEFTRTKNIRYPSALEPIPEWESARKVLR